MCIRASEESLSCPPSITFLPQKTADMLKDKELLKKKKNDPYLHLFQTQVDPSSQKRFRSRHKTKTTVTAITSSGGITTSLRFSLKIRIIVIYMKGLGVDWCMQNYQSRVALFNILQATQKAGYSMSQL